MLNFGDASALQYCTGNFSGSDMVGSATVAFDNVGVLGDMDEKAAAVSESLSEVDEK